MKALRMGMVRKGLWRCYEVGGGLGVWIGGQIGETCFREGD